MRVRLTVMRPEAHKLSVTEMMHAIFNVLLGLGIVLTVGVMLSAGPFG